MGRPPCCSSLFTAILSPVAELRGQLANQRGYQGSLENFQLFLPYTFLREKKKQGGQARYPPLYPRWISISKVFPPPRGLIMFLLMHIPPIVSGIRHTLHLELTGAVSTA